jgi:hypothetical protein
MKLLINDARLAFPQLFEAQSINGEGEPAFSCALLLSKKHAQLAEIDDAIEAVAREKWGAKTDDILAKMKASGKTALHNGDLKSEYDGFAGMLYINARNKTRPTVVDRDRTPLVKADGKPYSGCYVNASIELWAQDNKYGKHINASLRGVQFLRDGDAFAGGGAASEDEFENLSEGADADFALV